MPFLVRNVKSLPTDEFALLIVFESGIPNITIERAKQLITHGLERKWIAIENHVLTYNMTLKFKMFINAFEELDLSGLDDYTPTELKPLPKLEPLVFKKKIERVTPKKDDIESEIVPKKPTKPTRVIERSPKTVPITDKKIKEKTIKKPTENIVKKKKDLSDFFS